MCCCFCWTRSRLVSVLFDPPAVGILRLVSVAFFGPTPPVVDISSLVSVAFFDHLVLDILSPVFVESSDPSYLDFET